MENLPIEILSRILQYVNLADRREFALVCKKFYEASLDPALYWRSQYIFDAHALLPDEGDICFYCKSPNLFITDLSENVNVKALLNSDPSVLGPHVLKLSLKGSSILESSFVEILKKCEFLEGLDISCCNGMFMPGTFLSNNHNLHEMEKVLKELRDLNVSSIRYLDNRSLKTLIEITPLLESLSLSSCNICFSDFGFANRYALTFPVILQQIASRASTLVRIDLSRTGITNTALKDLAMIKDLRLREVILQNCKEVGDQGIVSFVKQQPGIRVFDVRACLEIGNQSLSAICGCLSNLRELYIAKCRKINDSSASRILFLEKLSVLDISECYDITESIVTITTSLPNLKKFTANGCNFARFHEDLGNETSKIDSKKSLALTGGVISTKLNNFSSLTKLCINSGRYITDLTLQSVFQHFSGLEDLSLSWCHYITDRGLIGLEVNLSLVKLFPSVEKGTDFLDSGRYSTNHGRNGFIDAPGSEFKISSGLQDVVGVNIIEVLKERGIGRLKNLKKLALSNCKNVTHESLIRIFCVGEALFPRMEQMELNMMKNSVTDDVLLGISFNCPLLNRLAISGSNVTDTAMEALVQGLHRLDSLDVSNCDKITPRFFTALIKNNQWLRELDISSCKQIPALSMENLRNSLPLLTRVHTRYSGV